MKVKVFNRQGQLVGPVEMAPVVKSDAMRWSRVVLSASMDGPDMSALRINNAVDST